MQKIFLLSSCLVGAWMCLFAESLHGQKKLASESKKMESQLPRPELGVNFFSKERGKEVLTGPIAVKLTIKSGKREIESTGVLHWLSTHTDPSTKKPIQKVSITYALNNSWIFYDGVTLQQANIETIDLMKFDEKDHPSWYLKTDKRSIFPEEHVKPTREWPLVVKPKNEHNEPTYKLSRWKYQQAYQNLISDLNKFDEKKLKVTIENLQATINELPENTPAKDKASLAKILDIVQEIHKDMQDRDKAWIKAIQNAEVAKNQEKNVFNKISSETSKIQHFGYLNDIDFDDPLGSIFRVSIRKVATEALMKKQYDETNAALKVIDDNLRANILAIQRIFQNQLENHVDLINTKYCEVMAWSASRYLLVNELKKTEELTQAFDEFKKFAGTAAFKNDPIVQLQLKFFEAATARDKDGLPAEWHIHRIALEAAQLIHLVPNQPEFVECRDTILQSAAEIALIASRREHKRREDFEKTRPKDSQRNVTPESSYAITAIALLEYVESQKNLPDTTGIRKALLNNAYQRTGQTEKRVP